MSLKFAQPMIALLSSTRTTYQICIGKLWSDYTKQLVDIRMSRLAL